VRLDGRASETWSEEGLKHAQVPTWARASVARDSFTVCRRIAALVLVEVWGRGKASGGGPGSWTVCVVCARGCVSLLAVLRLPSAVSCPACLKPAFELSCEGANTAGQRVHSSSSSSSNNRNQRRADNQGQKHTQVNQQNIKESWSNTPTRDGLDI